MKKKEIPVIFKGRQIYKVDPCRGIVGKVYDKFWKLYAIHKIYHPYTPTERIVIE